MADEVKTFTVTTTNRLLRSCEKMLAKHIAVNGACTNDLERLVFTVLLAEKEATKNG